MKKKKTMKKRKKTMKNKKPQFCTEELYELQEIPKSYDLETCFRCGSDEYEVACPDWAVFTDGWEQRTCCKCSAQWELSFYKNSIYFLGETNYELFSFEINKGEK